MPNYIRPIQEEAVPDAGSAPKAALASALLFGALILGALFASQGPGCSNEDHGTPSPTKASWGAVVAELQSPDADMVLLLEELDKATDKQGTKLLIVDDDTPIGADWARKAQEHGADPPLIMSFDENGNIVKATGVKGKKAEELLLEVGLWKE